MSMDVSEISKSLQRFSWPDYLVFVLMLISCMMIGVYYGWQDHQKHKNRKNKMRRGSEALDYLVGGRKMKVFPVAMSLVASFISGISLLGTSTEIYVYGTQYCYIFIPIVLTGVVLHYVYLPVYHELQLTSTYEYLRLRFDNKVRIFGSVLFLVNTMLWLPIVCYVPAIAFNQVSGVNIHIVTPTVCFICIFYTCVGGIKAVVWTDVVQTFVMVGGMLIVIYKGTADAGGIGAVLQHNWDSGRIESPNLSWDPTIRMTFWSVVIGGSVHHVGINAVQQAQAQRFFALGTLKKARTALWLFTVGVLGIIGMSAYNGLLAYATYHDCDPFTTNLAKAKDQLIPVLVMDVLGNYPGLPGMFIAGVFSAALSSLSTGLNSLVAVTLEDFIKPHWTDLNEKSIGWIMRTLVLFYGAVAISLVFVVEKLGTVLTLSATLSGTSIGPLLALFTLGLFFPWIRARYLDRRFGRRVRLLGSVIYLVTSTIWIPIVVYVPALAFNQVTGINIHVITPVVCLICIFYTCVGGIKAVVWTDVIQMCVMLGSLIVVAVKATLQVGGLGEVLSKNYESGRIEGPVIDIDPTVRHSIFSLLIGGFAYWVSVNGTSQSMVQRYLAVPTLRAARQTLWIFIAGIIILLSFCAYNGLLLYALYHDCDPLTTKLAERNDQLVPLLVMNILGGIPGMTGCFIAGVFSAALSSLSTGLNSLAAVVLEDFIKPTAWGSQLSDRATGLIMRCAVVVFGIIAVALVFVVEHLGQVLQLSLSLSGATLGPMMGIFTIGFFMPSIDARNTLVGAGSSLITVIWITVRAQFDLASGVLTFDKKPTSIEGCTYTFNATVLEPDLHVVEKQIHHISYLYYTLLGSILTILVAWISSFCLGRQDPHEVDSALLAPIIRKYYYKKEDYVLQNIVPDVETLCTTYSFEKAKLTNSIDRDLNEEKMKS